MGLSIHYSGTIKSPTLIHDLVKETEDVCNSFDWKYHLIKEPNDEKLNGIVFSAKGSEPVFLTFLPGRRMCSPINLINRDIYERNGFDSELIYTTSVKTQYAGPDVHIAIIKLLYYLDEKFFSSFKLYDEGGYWESMDEKELLKQFARYEAALNTLTAALERMKAVPEETTVSKLARIEKLLKDIWGKNDATNV